MSDGKVMTSASVPKVGEGAPAKPTAFTHSQEEDFGNIVAKPLRTPSFLNLKHKNSTMSIRWVNKAVGEKESTLRYNQCLAMGFTPCKPSDITDLKGNPCPDSLSKDNRVQYGDVILMQIPKKDYLGALKWNAQSARNRVRRFGSAMENGKEGHQQSGSREIPGSALADLPKKTSVYIPPLTGIDEGTNLAKE